MHAKEQEADLEIKAKVLRGSAEGPALMQRVHGFRAFFKEGFRVQGFREVL